MRTSEKFALERYFELLRLDAARGLDHMIMFTLLLSDLETMRRRIAELEAKVKEGKELGE